MIHEIILFRSKALEVAAVVNYCNTYAKQKMDKFKMLGYQVLINIVHKDLKVLVNNAG